MSLFRGVGRSGDIVDLWTQIGPGAGDLIGERARELSGQPAL
jgi:hypothetical protein